MKFAEFNSIVLPVTNEEHELLARLEGDVLKSDLSSREQVLINQLVQKNIVKRSKHNGKIIYSNC